MLDCEFVVVDGPYARRKFWGNIDARRHDRRACQGRRNQPRHACAPSSNRRAGSSPTTSATQARASPHGRAQGLRRHELHREDRHRERQAEERRQRRKLVRTRTSSPRSSRRTRRNGTGRAVPPPFNGGDNGAARAHLPIRNAVLRIAKPAWAVMKTRTHRAGLDRSAIEDAWQRRAPPLPSRRRVGSSSMTAPSRPARRSAGWATSNGAGSSPRSCSAGSRRAPSRRPRNSSTPSRPSG